MFSDTDTTMPDTNTGTDTSPSDWVVAMSRRKRSQALSSHYAQENMWNQVQRESGHLLAVAGKLGLERDCLLEALIFEALASTKGIEAFCKAEPTNSRDINILAFATPTGDIDTFLEVMRGWTGPVARRQGARGATKWCTDRGINERALKTIEKKVQRTYAYLQQMAPRQFLPRLHFTPESQQASSRLITDIISQTLAHSICVNSRDDALGYVEICSGDYIQISDSSVLNFLPERPQFIAYVDVPHSAMSATKRYLVALPDTIAMQAIADVTGQVPREVVASMVPQPVIFKNIGTAVQKRLRFLWDKSEGQQLRLNVCCNTCCLLELDSSLATVKVLCLAKYHDAVQAAVNNLIHKIQDEIGRDSFIVRYPFPWSKLRLAVESGVLCRCPLKTGDFISLAVRHSGAKISESDISTALSDFDIDIKKEEEGCGTSHQVGILWGVVTFQSSDQATKAHNSVFSSKFMLDPHHHKGLRSPLSSVKQTVNISVRWPKEDDQTLKLPSDVDLPTFKRDLWKSLEDVPQEKWRGTVYPTQDGQHYGAWVTTDDCTTAIRAASFLKTAEVRGLKVSVTNEEEVENQLKSFTIDMESRVYAVIKEVMWSRLGNLMRQEGSKMTCQEQLDSKTGWCKIWVKCAHSEVARHVMRKLSETLKPQKMPYKKKFMHSGGPCPEERDILVQKVMRETGTYIDADDFSDCLYIYGSKSARVKALKSLDKCVSTTRNWYMTNLFDGQYRPDVFMSLVKSKGNPSDIAKDFKVNAIELHPRAGYIMHRADRYYLGETFRVQVEKGLEFLKSPEVEEVDCVVCYTAIPRREAYFLEQCGHAYCKECIESQVKTSLDNTIFPLCCASCDLPFASQDLFNVCGRLKLFKLAAVLRGSLRCFVNGNMKQYRCCPHLSCDGIVDVTAEGTLRCSLCERRICPNCLEMLHEDKTCEEFCSAKRILQEWIKEKPSQRKQCPSCEIGIEKVDGCNNVFCTACKRNICWECMAHFGNANECYKHLQEEHGDDLDDF